METIRSGAPPVGPDASDDPVAPVVVVDSAADGSGSDEAAASVGSSSPHAASTVVRAMAASAALQVVRMVPPVVEAGAIVSTGGLSWTNCPSSRACPSPTGAPDRAHPSLEGITVAGQRRVRTGFAERGRFDAIPPGRRRVRGLLRPLGPARGPAAPA